MAEVATSPSSASASAATASDSKDKPQEPEFTLRFDDFEKTFSHHAKDISGFPNDPIAIQSVRKELRAHDMTLVVRERRISEGDPRQISRPLGDSLDNDLLVHYTERPLSTH